MPAERVILRSSNRRVPRGLRAAGVVHPFPTVLNALTAGALAFIATEGEIRLETAVHLMLAMLAIQACIGSVNDLVDRALDATGKPGKPLVEGVLSLRRARAIAWATFAAAIVLSGGFGPAAWLLAMAGLGCGLAYDFWLKRTPASGVPFIIALPLLPLWIWVAVGRFQRELLLLIPLGSLLGLALHLANSLPDYDSDTREGVRGLAQVLGQGRSIALCWSSFALVLLFAGGSVLLLAERNAVLLAGLGAGALALAAAVLLYLWRPARASLQAGWALLAGGSALLALGWLSSLPVR